MPSRLAAAVLVIVLATSCAQAPYVTERLFCGRAIPGGGAVTDEQWSAFLAEVVTPRFPDGLTILRGEGQWREGTNVIKEPVSVIEILHRGDPASRARVLEIAREYQRRFNQDAVLRVTTGARVEFVAR